METFNPIRETQHRSSSALSTYRKLACISGKMVSQADAGHWSEVVDLGEQYLEQVEQLKQIESQTLAERMARIDLLRQILKNDDRIRSLLHPELERLRYMMTNVKRQQTVLDTYAAAVNSQ